MFVKNMFFSVTVVQEHKVDDLFIYSSIYLFPQENKNMVDVLFIYLYIYLSRYISI